MIGLPVKMNSENSAVSPVFGKVKYFAIVDSDKNIKFVENVEKSGTKAVELLIQNGVKTLIVPHIGERPFELAISQGLKVYFAGKERVTILEAVEKFENGDFPDATTIDKALFIGHGSNHHHHH
jgi:predicted Fe-Mo cluster-binding NifX family protein